MPKSSTHGWGIAGTFLSAEIAKLPPVEGVTLHCISGHDFKPFDESAWDSINIGYSFFEYELLAKPYITQAAQKWDHIVVGSHWCEQHLRNGGMRDTSTILQGIEHSLFFRQQPRADDGRFIVFSGGKFEFRKGQDIVIAAMRLFMARHSDAWLSCSWHNLWPQSLKTMEQSRVIDFRWHEMPGQDLLRETIVRNGLDSSRVLLHPSFINSRMPLIYAESDIGVFPNRCEGGNNMVMCEYMACGRTVIASNQTGHADVLTCDNAYCLTDYSPLTLKAGNVETAIWPEPSVDEVLEMLEKAYHDRQHLQNKSDCAARDLTRLSWCEAASQFHALAVRLASQQNSGVTLNSNIIDAAEALFKAERYSDAETLYLKALHDSPLSAPLHNCLGTVLDRQGRYQEALAHYNKALSLHPDSHSTRINLANTLARVGYMDEAITELSALVAQESDLVNAWQILAHFHLQKDNREDRVRCLEQVVRLDPANSALLLELADAYEELRHFEDRLACLDSASSLTPDNVSLLNSKGLVLHELGRLDEAEANYMKALAIEPRHAVVCNNVGNIYKSRIMMREAIEWYDRALETDSDNATIIFNRSLAYLTLGDFLRGWPGYERRFDMIPPVVLPHQNIPLWNGEPLNGRRLLIQAEQVYGDTFMFARFVGLANRCGGPVVFECQDNSVRKALYSIELEVESLVVRGEPLPAIDLRIPLLSLPRLFDISLDTLPHPHWYLKADPACVEQWRHLIPLRNDMISVGLVWGGRKAPLNADRSMTLSTLDQVLQTPGVRFFSLQLGEDAGQLIDYPYITDLGAHLHDFCETAAAIACLDLVITIDTAVAHLAGALGVPVWMMLKYSPDWRWLLDRNDSPWYASARLFRQKTPGDWGSVMQTVADVLKKISAGRK